MILIASASTAGDIVLLTLQKLVSGGTEAVSESSLSGSIR